MTDLGVPFEKASWRTLWRMGTDTHPDSGVDANKSHHFPLIQKTAVRSLGERHAQVRHRARLYLAKQLRFPSLLSRILFALKVVRSRVLNGTNLIPGVT
jgi:hypothetical protein